MSNILIDFINLFQRCEFGVLKNCYGEGDLELYDGRFDLNVDGWKSMSVISLREAAILSNLKHDFIVGRCNCKKG